MIIRPVNTHRMIASSHSSLSAVARFSSNDSSRSSVIESDWVRRFGAERVAEMRSLLVELTSVSPEPLAAPSLSAAAA
jgi:hypothetical protein